MLELAAVGPVLLAIGVPLAAFALLGAESRLARAIAALVGAMATLRYILWRWAESMPANQQPIQQLWAWLFFGFEAATMLSSVLVYLFMSRVRDRSSAADAGGTSPLLSAPVDVFIATYNEPYDVLERTIVGATSIEHPDLRVWVLDDSARPWVRELALELGCHYVFRVDRKHAKAGNVNNGLREALSTGRRPEFLLLLDADFVAARHILRRTLPLFAEPDVGIVQTPQHFFNFDPVQSNLLCTSAWPDEQRFFFNNLLASKDAWGAAFCCGTSALFRASALEHAGGMAVETVTEDMLTTFKLGEYGYRTVFLNEQLSLGLAPEGLQEYISQRTRWCLGAIQQIYTRWSFAGNGRISLINRLSAFDGVLFWGSSFTFKLLMIAAPMIYWWTGTAVMDCTLEQMISRLGAHVAASLVFMALICGNRVLPVMTDVTHLLCAGAIVRTFATGIVNPWGRAFKVTAKGKTTDKITVQWGSFGLYAAIAIGTLAGMVVNMDTASSLFGTPGYQLNVFWSIFNIAVLTIAAAVCVELPRQRRDERFTSGEVAIILAGDGSRIPCQVRDISVGGARLRREGDWDSVALDQGELLLDYGALRLPFTTRREADGILAIRFDDDKDTRRALIRKLFTGRYGNEVERVSIARTTVGVVRKVFA